MHLSNKRLAALLAATVAFLPTLAPFVPPPRVAHADDPSFAAAVIALLLRIVNPSTGQDYPPDEGSGAPGPQAQLQQAAAPGRTTITVTTQAPDGRLVTNTITQAVGSGLSSLSIPDDIPGLVVPQGYAMTGRVQTGFTQASRGNVRFLDQGFVASVPTQRITDLSGSSGVQGSRVSIGIHGEGLAGAMAVVFSGTGVTGTVATGGVSDTFVPVDVAVAGAAEPGPRSFTVITPRGPVFSPAGLTFTVVRAPVITAPGPLAPAAARVQQAGTGPSVKYSITYVTAMRFVRPASAVGPSQLVIPVSLAGLQLRTTPVPGTTARVAYDWKVESPQVQAFPLFQSTASVELGKTGDVSGTIPASRFDLSDPGVVRLRDDLEDFTFPLPAISEGLPAVDLTVTFTLSGEGAVVDAAAQPLSPSDGANLGNFAPRLAWRQPSLAVAYHVQVVPLFGDGPGINLIIGDKALVSQSAFQVRAPAIGAGNYVLLPGATYSWRVRLCVVPEGCDAETSWTGWSAPWTFTTPRPSSSSVSLREPAASATVDSRTPTLIWTDTNPSIFYYEVQLSTDRDFGQGPRGAVAAVQHVLVHAGLTTPPRSYTPAADLAPGVYHWRVRPRVQATRLGPAEPGVAWTPPASFSVP